MSRRIKLVVAYDGTAYHGWQLQPGRDTIESMLNAALSGLFDTPVQVIGASRTDSGVHARGNVAVFDTEARMPAEKMAIAVNQRLPEDIRVQSSEEVPADWHPRKQNAVKTYRYNILNSRTEDPLRGRYSTFCRYPLDVDVMEKTGQLLLGEHDFASFCAPRTQAKTTVRTIYRLRVSRDVDDMVAIEISGSGFLYNMVRIIAGTLMQVGSGQISPDQVSEILERRDRRAAGPTAPARGLILQSICYEREPVRELRGENRHYAYTLDQSGLLATPPTPSRLRIARAEEGELAGLVSRVVNQAYRNGACGVLVRERADSGAVLPLVPGRLYGSYMLMPAEDAGWLRAAAAEDAGISEEINTHNG